MRSVTKEPKQEFVDQLVSDQIKLEEQFAPKVRKMLTDMGQDVASIYISTRTIIPLDNYRPQMITLLRDHYRRVIPKFGYFLRDRIAGSKSKRELMHKFVHWVLNKKNIDDDFDTESVVYINNHSENQADIIIGNQQNVAEDNINKALISLLLLMGTPESQIAPVLQLDRQGRRSILENMVDSNVTFSQERKNRELRRLINRENRLSAVSRSNAIALTETNNSINFAMETETELAQNDPETIAAGAAVGVAVANLQKEWVAVLDSRTRPTHVAADGQVVGINENFVVGGYQMRFPTDSSLGAPAGEIVNCRCKSIIVT